MLYFVTQYEKMLFVSENW